MNRRLKKAMEYIEENLGFNNIIVLACIFIGLGLVCL